MKIKTILTSAAASSILMMGGQAMAAGNASLSLGGGSYQTGNSFSVPVYVNSAADPINVVQADFSYDTSALQFQGVSCGGAFGITAGAAANSVTCGVSNGSSVTGSQLVATINFKAIGSGSSVANIASSSHVYRSTDNADVWNGVPTSTGFSFSSPAPITRSTPSRSTLTTSSNPVVSTDSSVTPAPVVKAAVTKKPAHHKVAVAAPVAKASNLLSWLLISFLVLLMALVVASAAWLARHPKQYNSYRMSSKRLYKHGLQLMPFSSK